MKQILFLILVLISFNSLYAFGKEELALKSQSATSAIINFDTIMTDFIPMKHSLKTNNDQFPIKDLNNDGKPDVAIPSWSSKISGSEIGFCILLNNPNFQAPKSIYSPQTYLNIIRWTTK